MTDDQSPKVFISYAWTSDVYQEKVRSFAAALMDVGIETVIDQWDLKPGNNVHAFMEKIDNDKTIDKVLILINPKYATKANNKQGGVSTETQIISPEVYNNVAQTRYLPIIFETNQDGSIEQPTFLKSTIYFDLTKSDTYDSEFRKLVKTIYGKDIHQKPKRGNKPSWVDEDNDLSFAPRITRNEEIRKNPNETERTLKFKQEIEVLKKQLLDFSSIDNYVSIYDELQKLKKDYLSLFSLIPYIPKAVRYIITSFEAVIMEIRHDHSNNSVVKQLLLHEMFIYLIAVCYKNELFSEIGYLLTRSYESDNPEGLDTFKIFCANDRNFDDAYNNKNNSRYYSGMSKYWIDTLDVNICSKEELVFADVLCFNVALFYNNRCRWFPYLYIYDNDEWNSRFVRFTKGLKSKERLVIASAIFGFENSNDFVKKFKDMSEDPNFMEYLERFNYNRPYTNPAQSLFKFIKNNELGKCN